MDSQLNFSISAIFIGANLALASVVHFKELLRFYKFWYELVLIITIVISVICSIVASEWILTNIYIARFAIYLLIGDYLVIIYLCYHRIKLGPNWIQSQTTAEEHINEGL